ncbi:universal stress protein [Curvivirga sp.]|uniref:universal stress protein n=1 Tax=Curvivirga sp. TaxID=2856848 RepID=UPI003B5CD5B8
MSDETGASVDIGDFHARKEFQARPRVFLVLVDDSAEMPKALRFASLRAKHTGGMVALLHVQDNAEFHHWLGVEALMKEEAREEAEALLQKLSETVNDLCGSYPIIYMREGDRANQLFDLLEEDETISIVVLATSAEKASNDHVINHLTGKGRARMRTPFTIVPGNLSDEEIDALTVS